MPLSNELPYPTCAVAGHRSDGRYTVRAAPKGRQEQQREHVQATNQTDANFVLDLVAG